MAIDFPASPSVGQIFTSVGCSWRWSGTKWVVANATGGGLSGDVGRNLIHNPLFNVAQRGVGPFTSGYTADRWPILVAGSSISTTIVAIPDSDRAQISDEAAAWALNSVATGTAGANDAVIGAYQSIEDVRRLAGKTVTLSFWAKVNAGTPRVGIEYIQNFGTGGSPSASVVGIGMQAITLSTAWTRYTTTPFVMPSVIGKTLGTAGNSLTQVRFWQSAGANINNAEAAGIGVQSYTLLLWGVQLEIGSVATSLEKPDPQQDLAKCQRFYIALFIRSDFSANAGVNASYTVTLPTTMRGSQTVAFTGVSLANCSGLATSFVSQGSVGYFATVTATGNCTIAATMALTADL